MWKVRNVRNALYAAVPFIVTADLPNTVAGAASSHAPGRGTYNDETYLYHQ